MTDPDQMPVPGGPNDPMSPRPKRATLAALCDYTDRDLFTNRPIRCDEPKHHVGFHRVVFVEEVTA